MKMIARYNKVNNKAGNGMSDDLEVLWRNHMAAQKRYRELIEKLPSRPIDWIEASPEEQDELYKVGDELEKTQAIITETWEAIKRIKPS
jgi:hypothetical protein